MLSAKSGPGQKHAVKSCRGTMVEPIGAAIDHHARMTEPHQQGAVAEMAAGPDLDLAPGAEKGELDAALLALLDRDPLLVLLSLWTLGQSYRGLNSGRSE
jgi:hypothetical protein